MTKNAERQILFCQSTFWAGSSHNNVINQNHLFKIYPLISFLDLTSFWAEIQTFEQHWTVEKKEKEGENKGSQNEFPPTEN